MRRQSLSRVCSRSETGLLRGSHVRMLQVYNFLDVRHVAGSRLELIV
jgi:hypothetical protein